MWEDCSAVGQRSGWVHPAPPLSHWLQALHASPLALAKSHLKSLLAGGAGEGGNGDLD